MLAHKVTRKILLSIVLLVITIALNNCAMQSTVQPTARVDTGLAQQLPPYTGPKARIAIARFDWKVGRATKEEVGYMDGLRDMLSTALVQSGRYRVLERQELGAIKEEIGLGETSYAEKESAVKRGKIKGADLLVVAAITGWEPGTSGVRGGVGAGTLGVIGGVLGSLKKSSMAMDIRIIDTATSEVLAATRIEGEARDIDLSALAGGLIGNVGLIGGLSGFAKTPMEKAIRICINEAVKYIVSATPPEYMKY